MGIYIKGMEMPENCAGCPYSTLGMDCVIEGKSVHVAWLERKRPDWCPLVPVPPHGRLIDADKYEFPGDLKDEPTVIPAEEEHNG